MFSFGSDPEFMLVSEGKFVSAIGIIPGTKEDKVSLGNNHYAFYDNVLAEVNVNPGNSKDEVINNFKDCFCRLAKLVGNIILVPQASQVYPREECLHEDALKFGCDPEFCIYIKDENGRVSLQKPPVLDPENTFRSGGGHIHIGHDICLPWFGKPINVVSMLDVFVGIPSILMDHDPTSAARRKLYGGAGTHRIKQAYGLEYRTLSNFWLASPKLVSMIYDLVSFVLDSVDSGKYPEAPSFTRELINSGDRTWATQVFQQWHKDKMPSDLHEKVMALATPVKYDFYKEWQID